MSRWEPNTVERLQDAAMTLFHERGYSDVTVADIAGRAGLTKRTFFNHFADKREVLFAGSNALEEQVERYILESEAELPAIDIAISALTSAGQTLSNYSEVARLRQDVIASSPELHERSLIKMASLSQVIAAALVARDRHSTEATLVADSAVTVFGTAYAEWVDSPASAFPDLMNKVLTDLKTAIGAASPAARLQQRE
ncbi:TetR family transcriptional regulator [Cryobacterium lactosi]|uniref:TetR family transcriptional regulator n=1 Tax=Cryobacterium lactosi TaxID=1259202 RepID=A0A4R9BMJ0_9MICO|nr:TetR/AcrR family transcriptional regulator [Cryobacterium lactosi]TFD86994.1 TetR family transcriptional regulator [Cryobacterium lactosi]